MTDTTARPAPQPAARLTPDLSGVRLRRRQNAEKRFKAYGLIAILLALSVLAVLLVSIVSKGYSAFVQTEVALDVRFDAALIDPQGSRDPAVLADANL